MRVLIFLSGLLITLFSFFNLGNMTYQSIRVQTNILRPLEIASSFQDPKDVEHYLSQALNFIEESDLATGNSCLFFSSTPQCDLSNFHKKLKQDIQVLEEIKDEPISSYTTTNALNRIQQSLVGQIPNYNFVIRWGTSAKLLTKTLEWFSGIVGSLCFLVGVLYLE